MSKQHSGSIVFANVFMATALTLSPGAAVSPLRLVSEVQTPLAVEAPAGFGDWSAFRVQLELRSANDYVRASKVVSRWLGELPKADARYPLQMRALVTGAEQERLTRMGIRPALADELNALLEGHAKDAGDTVKALKPVLAQLNAGAAERISERLSTADAEARLRSVLVGLSVAKVNGLNALTSLDDDGDGLTNTQEAWWCTNPLNANSDGDANGWSDSREVFALLDVTLPRTVRWAYGPPFGPPNAWPDFNGADGNPNTPACNDGDFDTIPDYAEVWMVGTRVPEESTDLDKFDDGQELFGTTYCPGAPTSCGYGTLPAGEYWNYVKASMPNWVRPPGDSPFVAAYPVPQVTVEEGSWKVDKVTTISTQQGQMEQASRTYGSEARRGQSTAIANQVNWNNWEEVSESVEAPLTSQSFGSQLPYCPQCVNYIYQEIQIVGPVVVQRTTPLWQSAVTWLAGTVVGAVIAHEVENLLEKLNGEDKKDDIEPVNKYQDNGLYCPASPSPLYSVATEVDCGTEQSGLRYGASVPLDNQTLALASNGIQYGLDMLGNLHAADVHDVSLSIDRQTAAIDKGLSNVANAILAPRRTETRTNGRSWGGSQTVTNEEYEEHALTEQNGFTTGENWSTAWSVDSSHVADLVFTYTIKNAGTEYARELTGMLINVYLNDVLISNYPAHTQFANGRIENLFPADAPITLRSTPIALTLDQMRQVDTGGRFRVVVEDYSYGADELFYQNAINGGVTFYIEDGVDDNDESVDTYVVPTWKTESVEQVLTRYFPAAYDAEGLLNSLWSPEFSGTNPPVFKEHFLSDLAWWNIYMTQPDGGTTPLRDLQAQAGSAILIRMNRDSDRDGYQDRVEIRYGTDRTDPASRPTPEILAGYVSTRTGGLVTITVALENSGTFDAYGIQVTMYSPDDTTTVIDNIVGGNGRVRPGQHVAVGSYIKAPVMGNWSGSTAKPYGIGDYSGPDRTFTFTVSAPGPVGSGSTAVAWTTTGGISGTLSLGASYHAPLPANVKDGLQVGFNTGVLAAWNWFTVTALTPRDTLRYRINTDPNNSSTYTQPVIIVSTNDPQGNRRFVTPIQLSYLSQSLAPFTGQMLTPLEFAIRTNHSVTTTGPNSTAFVFNSPHAAPIIGARLYLDFVADGARMLAISRTLDIQSGPNIVQVDWTTAAFSETYDANKDNILIAYWTDSENNIIDTAARPLNLFLPESNPILAMPLLDADWDFGSAAQGTLMKRSFTFANVGLQDMLTYIQGVPGLSLSQTGSRRVGAADQTTYEIALNTIGLPVGVYDQSIVIRTSDQTHPTQTVRVHGVVTIGPADGLPSGLLRPLDTIVTVTSGVPGTLVTFDHGLNQPFLDRLHPIKVFANPAGALIGVGKYATEFGVGVVDANMFGNGGDVAAPSGGNFDAPNGIGIGSINSGAIGSYAINVSNQQNSIRIRAGNMVMLHQSRGTNAGCWEVNQSVTDFSGGNSIQSMVLPLKCNYSSAGNDRAQVIRIPQYGTCSNMSGTYWLPASWNGTFGGILPIMCNSSFVLNGSISANGGNGATGTDGHPSGGVGGGFWGGAGDAENNDSYGIGVQGEGTAGPNAYGSGANGNGGGAGPGNPSTGNYGTGGGGGNGTAGAASTAGGLGAGGLMAGNPALTNMVFGGGGGGSNDNPGNSIGGGGAGGGIVVIFAPDITINGSIVLNGGNGGGSKWGAGGGAGGSALLRGRNVNFGSSKISAIGGNPGNRGGAGASGRVRVEYCSTRAGSSNPSAIEAQISCYSVEQVEAPPFSQGRLNPPNYGTVAYNVQYGWRNLFSSPGYAVATIRVPAGPIGNVQFDVLGSQMGGTGSVSVDVANSPGVECSGAVANVGSLVCNSTGLRDAFVAYWRSQNSPISGTLDVPITVTLDRAGQILLTNLQVQTTGSKVRYLQLPAQAYSAINLRYNVGQAANLAIDVGDDGSIDQNVNVPAGEYGLDLTTAINAYLSTHNGVVNVPLRIYLSPFTTFDLVSFSAAPTLRPDASITLADVSFSDAEPTESDTISVTAVLRNGAARDTGGLVASAFAILSGTSASYIGSAFVPSIPASGTATTEIAWNTIGFTGNVPVRIVIDPYNRVSETIETNNVATRTLSIIARPDLQITQADSGGLDEVAAGEVLSLSLRVANHGQRAAVTETLAVYDGNPAQSGVLLGTLVAPPIGGGSTTDLVFVWQPTVVGEHKLFFRADKDNAVNEYDEGNNDLARTLYVGVAGGYDVDSGLLASDPVYSSTLGFGAIDTGQPDALQNCGPLPDDSYRRDPDGTVTYRFDRLLRARYYHLDIVLRDCVSGSNRLEAIEVNGSVLATGIDLNDGKAHYLSFLLDPKLYDERTITVKISAPGGQGAIVSRVTVREVLYRYVDAGLTTGSDTPWTTERGYGWLGTYNVNTNCGPLPYQTARVNQSGNTLQYRFDGLDPAKRYKVALSLYQCTGSGVTQRLDIDGNVVGADLVAQNGSLLAVTRKVPQTVYQADGSIVVSIIRTNSSANAMIGEVILEEETTATAPVCEGLVRFTPYDTNVFGDVFINGIPAPAGTLVTAENPRGETVGCFAVATAGDYGFMKIFGEDTASNPPIPGMRAGEPVRFRVDGVVAVGMPLLQWQTDSAIHQVDLNAGATQAQPILLATGWNFISFRAEPPVPLIDNVLESIAGKYCRVLGLDGASNCALPEAFRTLKQMHSGSGYYTHITSTTSVYATVEGLVQPVDKPIPMKPGWNWIGYYPPTPLPVTVALRSIITYVVQVSQLNSLFVPGDPVHSTLSEMEPGKGYRVYISGTAPLTLTYPLAPALLMGSSVGAPEEKVDPTAAALVCSAVQPTPRMSFIYGDLGMSPGMPAGTLIEALTPDGKLAGCEVTRYAGQYGFMAVFGAEGDTPGYHTGEPILLRINGAAMRTTTQLWVDDIDVHRVDIAGAYTMFLPKIERAQTESK